MQPREYVPEEVVHNGRIMRVDRAGSLYGIPAEMAEMTDRERELYDANPKLYGDLMTHDERIYFAKYLAGLERTIANRTC